MSKDKVTGSFLEEQFGVPIPKALGYYVLVKHLSDLERQQAEGRSGSIILPDSVIDAESSNSSLVMVLSIGSHAFKDKMFAGSEPWVELGDIVMIPRREAYRFKYNGHICSFVADSCFMGKDFDYKLLKGF